MTGANTISNPVPASRTWVARFDHLWWPMIVLAIASTCVIGSVGSIASVVCALLALPVLLDGQVRAQLRGQWDILVFPIFFVVLGLIFAINAEKLSDMVFLFNFTSLPLAVTIYALARRHSGGKWPLVIITLAFVGAVLGTLLGAVQIAFDLTPRAVGLFNNPNMYAHIILILGFMSVPGLFLTRSPWRWLFLAGPFLAIAGTVLSGSRGTMLALPVASVLALAFVLTQPNSRRWVFGALASLFVILGVWLVFFAHFDGTLARITQLTDTLREVIETGASEQTGTQTRLEVYAGAWQAFLRSPLIGYGWAGAVPAAVIDIPPSPVYDIASKFRHMHSDFFGFAAGAGIFGILGYFAMLLAPLYSLRHRDALFWHRAYLAALVISSYAIFGVLDAMFGFDTGISTYVMLTAILAGTFTGGDTAQKTDQPDT